jgi:hypothetical protein
VEHGYVHKIVLLHSVEQGCVHETTLLQCGIGVCP